MPATGVKRAKKTVVRGDELPVPVSVTLSNFTATFTSTLNDEYPVTNYDLSILGASPQQPVDVTVDAKIEQNGVKITESKATTTYTSAGFINCHSDYTAWKRKDYAGADPPYVFKVVISCAYFASQTRTANF